MEAPDKVQELAIKLQRDRLNPENYAGGFYKLGEFLKRFIKENKFSQDEIILAHILGFHHITNAECNEIYGFRHLPSIIQTIEEKIKPRVVNSVPTPGTNRFGEKTTYHEYSLGEVA